MSAVEKLLTTQDVAELLGVKPGTVENWRYLGKGPSAIKVGGAVRYRSESIQEWINDREQV